MPRRFEEGLAEDPAFAQRFEDLDRTLAERAEREIT